MKAASVEYARPDTLADALALLAARGEAARPIAGGQSLVPALNLRLAAPALLVDIGRLAELQGVAVKGGVLRLGALTRHAALLEDPAIGRAAPLLPMAAAHVAHPAIRSRGTLGGSLAHADPAAELPACCLALDARLVVRSVRGERRVAAAAFFKGLFATDLAPDELLVAVEVPIEAEARPGFLEFARRGGDYAMAGLAAQGAWQGGRIAWLRLAYFSVGSAATLAERAAALLVEGGVGALAAAEAALAADLEPHADLQASAATRLHLARVLLRRVMRQMAPEAAVAA
jgi:carbon-monoxide dehydrogenase medium subunit